MIKALLRPFAIEAGYDLVLAPYRIAADKVMLRMCVFLQCVCIAIAPARGTWGAAIMIGGGTLALSALLVRRRPGAMLTRNYLGCAFMIYTALIIHQTGGSIEGHFAAFGLIGILLYYRDWRVILAATLFIYMHHMILGYAQSLGFGVYVFDIDAFWYKFAIHVAYFLPFVGLMGYLAIGLRREGYENLRVIALAKEVAEGDFSAATRDGSTTRADVSGLMESVRRMHDCMVNLVRYAPTATMIVRMNDGAVLSVNAAWESMFGLTAAAVVGASAPGLALWIEPAFWRAITSGAQEGQTATTETKARRTDGVELTLNACAMPHESGDLRLMIVSLDDISLRRESERRIHRLAYFDSLTDLHNRASLRGHLAELLAAPANGALAVILIDLDDFKPVNDTFGHEAGDQVLRIVARRIDDAKRPNDFSARLGGDEFAVAISECPTPEFAISVAKRIQHAVKRRIALDTGVACHVGATMGIAWREPAGSPTTVEDVLRTADQALYRGKRGGKGRIQFYTEVAEESEARQAS